MRRFEALEPYKDAIRSLLRSARSNPGLACALNSLALRSQRWMLAAANLPSGGPVGMIRAQGLALLYGQVLATFIDDDDPGHARTMARLDRALSRGEWWAGMLDNLCRFVPARARAADPAPPLRKTAAQKHWRSEIAVQAALARMAASAASTASGVPTCIHTPSSRRP